MKPEDHLKVPSVGKTIDDRSSHVTLVQEDEVGMSSSQIQTVLKKSQADGDMGIVGATIMIAVVLVLLLASTIPAIFYEKRHVRNSYNCEFNSPPFKYRYKIPKQD